MSSTATTPSTPSDPRIAAHAAQLAANAPTPSPQLAARLAHLLKVTR